MAAWERGKAELVEQIQQLEHELDEVKKQQQATPTHLSWETLPQEAPMRTLGPGSQTVAGHGEDDRLPSGDGNGGDYPQGLSRADDARSLLRDLFTRTADILPDEHWGALRVQIDASSNPRHDRTVAHLLEQITAAEQTYPGAKLKLTYTLAGAVPNPNPGS